MFKLVFTLKGRCRCPGKIHRMKSDRKHATKHDRTRIKKLEVEATTQAKVASLQQTVVIHLEDNKENTKSQKTGIEAAQHLSRRRGSE